MEITINESSEFLYHFTSREKVIEKILPSLRLKLNSLRNTNDPKESKLSTLHAIDNFQFAGEYIAISSEFQNLIEKKYKICCFSSDYYRDKKPFPGYGLPRMWATYGDNHKGVCLMISKQKFIEENKIDNQKSHLVQVKYDKDASNKFELMNAIESKNYLKAAEDLIYSNLTQLFFSKHHDWITENEIRFLTDSETNFCSIEDSLVHIILGMDFDLKYKPSITAQLIDKHMSRIIDIRKIVFNHLTGNLILTNS